MIRLKKSVTFLAVLLVMGACSPKSENPQLVASPDKASILLADAADRASVALETLAAVEQSRTPQASVSPVADAPPELRRAVTVNWVGPAEPILRQMADRAGYAFQTLGVPPVTPLVVSVDVENTPVIDVMRSIGLQLGARSKVHVNGRTRTVELHYAPHTGVGR